MVILFISHCSFLQIIQGWRKSATVPLQIIASTSKSIMTLVHHALFKDLLSNLGFPPIMACPALAVSFLTPLRTPNRSLTATLQFEILSFTRSTCLKMYWTDVHSWRIESFLNILPMGLLVASLYPILEHNSLMLRCYRKVTEGKDSSTSLKLVCPFPLLAPIANRWLFPPRFLMLFSAVWKIARSHISLPSLIPSPSTLF